ncbi:MAG TPA: phosphoadenylyl-sulfate reductase [Caulobacteraceae bacterium]|nr:phosphoadenylyl-sulfate reductase [Caulobacteraceae bacterium]
MIAVAGPLRGTTAMELARSAVERDGSALEALDAATLIERVLVDRSFGRVGVVSSFGAESAVLLHLVARVDTQTPVLFIDTGKLFGETLRYAERLKGHLGLTDFRMLEPQAETVASADPRGDLWREDADACCEVRKVVPLTRALGEFDTWITGRKRFQGPTRATLDKTEIVDGRLKVNPLATWTRADLDDYFAAHDLPRHPLEADGFLSIGCYTCTERVGAGEDSRAGRWRGLQKTECGIHIPAGGAAARMPPR